VVSRKQKCRLNHFLSVSFHRQLKFYPNAFLGKTIQGVEGNRWPRYENAMYAESEHYCFGIVMNGGNKNAAVKSFVSINGLLCDSETFAFSNSEHFLESRPTFTWVYSDFKDITIEVKLKYTACFTTPKIVITESQTSSEFEVIRDECDEASLPGMLESTDGNDSETGFNSSPALSKISTSSVNSDFEELSKSSSSITMSEFEGIKQTDDESNKVDDDIKQSTSRLDSLILGNKTDDETENDEPTEEEKYAERKKNNERLTGYIMKVFKKDGTATDLMDTNWLTLKNAFKEQKDSWGKSVSEQAGLENFMEMLLLAKELEFDLLKSMTIQGFMMTVDIKQLVASEGWKTLRQHQELYQEVVELLLVK